MFRSGEDLQLSATDLIGHLNCRHLTTLDIKVADGVLAKPASWDPLLEVLWERGAIHEKGYVEHLENLGLTSVRIDGVGIDQVQVEQTLVAMRSGVAIIVQGAFLNAPWSGRTDILRRVETPSELGNWSYEVTDTKLARETKAGTILQLCLYTDLLAIAQGKVPEEMHVVVPWASHQPQTYRTADYAAYFRRVKRTLESAVSEASPDVPYPDPTSYCDICRWRAPCDARRRSDDHLCLVAGITKVHIDELKQHSIGTVTQLAAEPLPLSWKPDRGAVHSYQRIREQARIQIAGRDAKEVLYELLPLSAGLGLASLPSPSPGDIFLDLEGDPFVGESGLEYLFGYAFLDDTGAENYVGEWAFSRDAEKTMFERFIDFVMERWARYPNLHIYHYASYEPAALKRLMGRYVTREDELDRMLRASLFVDLYNVVRQSLRASVESYSIKKLEPLYNYQRLIPLAEVNAQIARLQAHLELGDIDAITSPNKSAVQTYNQDDCLSTLKLRDWLESLRANLVSSGSTIERPIAESGEASVEVDERQRKVLALVERLTADVPADALERSEEQQARWLLAHLLDWHRREEKADWWEHFRLCELSSEELLDERAGVAGLTFLENVGGTTKSPVHRYRFPSQETELRGSEDLLAVGGAKLGSVESIVLADRTIDIKKSTQTASLHPDAAFSHVVIQAREQAKALMRIGEYVRDNGIVGEGPYQAARNLLLRTPPAIGTGALKPETETALEAALRIGPLLDGGVLPIQGPPGAGKTFTGARMICELVQRGAKVGITATSHKVIRNLLDEVVRTAEDLKIRLQCVQKVSELEENQPRIKFAKDNGAVFETLRSTCQVAAGTSWLWSREEAHETVDVLFVDEAGQMSLANVIAVSQSAKSIVLLGDPQQLDQPMKGSHPPGTDVSALDHILGEHQTIPADRGLFLEETWRLHPDICAFSSEVFYDGRLRSRGGLERQVISSGGRIRGTGLRYLPAIHKGNQSSAPEEADSIRDLVLDVFSSKTAWTDMHGIQREVGWGDILIIAPYNAQVFEIAARLPKARVGTVDKFQGQEAPIAIYSMTTSTYADAPRGMEFLYSGNRLNVAVSRARCISILVASPTVFEAECRTPRQVQLANAFCRFLEMSTEL